MLSTSSAPGAVDVIATGMTMTQGFFGNGGAIEVFDETIYLRGCVVSNSTSNVGGGILVSGDGELTLDTSVVSGNQATSAGGGGGVAFLQHGSYSIISSTVSGNISSGDGAGLTFIGQPTGPFQIRHSTFSGNFVNAAGGGGGISLALASFTNYSSNVPLLVQNTTISANKTSGGSGGGIANSRLNSTIVVQNSTIAFNSASNSGGGIFTSSLTVLALESSIVGKNTSAASGPDILAQGSGTVQFKTSSLFNSAGIVNLVNLGGNRPFLEDPLLLPLASYGGPTKTHGLALSSPVMNKGSNPSRLDFDQRGGPNFLREIGIADMGAFEANLNPIPNPIIINGNAVQRSKVTTIQVDFNDIVTLPANPETAFELRRQSDGALVGLTAEVSNDVVTHVTLRFTGATTEFGSLRDGRYTLTAIASKITNAAGQLDGNFDGIPGDDFVLVGTPANGLFRQFGDSDGDGDVDAIDFGAFRQAFGTGNPIFDSNGDGDVDAEDFGFFRTKFGVIV